MHWTDLIYRPENTLLYSVVRKERERESERSRRREKKQNISSFPKAKAGVDYVIKEERRTTATKYKPRSSRLQGPAIQLSFIPIESNQKANEAFTFPVSDLRKEAPEVIIQILCIHFRWVFSRSPEWPWSCKTLSWFETLGGEGRCLRCSRHWRFRAFTWRSRFAYCDGGKAAGLTLAQRARASSAAGLW